MEKQKKKSIKSKNSEDNLIPQEITKINDKNSKITVKDGNEIKDTENVNVFEKVPDEVKIPSGRTEKIDVLQYPRTDLPTVDHVESINDTKERTNKIVENVEHQPKPKGIDAVTAKLTTELKTEAQTPVVLVDPSRPIPLPVKITPDLSRIKEDISLTKTSQITTINIPDNIIQILPCQERIKIVRRAKAFISFNLTITELYESGQGKRIAPQIELYDVIFKLSAIKFVPDNFSVMSITPSWNQDLLNKYKIYTMNGNIISESMYTKKYAPVNALATSGLEEKTGRALLMLVLMYEPKPILITPNEDLITIGYINTGFDHLSILNNKTLLNPATESISLAVPSMKNQLVAKKITDIIDGSNWQVGRISTMHDENGIDTAIIYADDVDHFTAHAYNQIANYTMNNTMTASQIRDMVEHALIPGSTLQLIDTTDRAKYYHSFVTNPRSSELVITACCMFQNFARSIRPRIIDYLRTSGAVVENLSGRPEDGFSSEVGYLDFLNQFRAATPSSCVDTFYSSQIPKVTLPIIRRHPTDNVHIYGIIPVFAAVTYAYMFPQLAYYARDEIARIIFEFGTSFFPEETRNFYAAHGHYDNLPGNETSYNTIHGYNGHVPSIFIPFTPAINYYSDLAELMLYKKTSFTQNYANDYCARFNQSNQSWPMFYQRDLEFSDSLTPVEMNIIVKKFESIIKKISTNRKLQGSVINTVITNIKNTIVNLNNLVPAMETELAQLERKVTTMPLVLGTHFQGSLSTAFSPIIGLETTHPNYMSHPLFLEQLDPNWEIDFSVVLVSAYGITMRSSEYGNTTINNEIKIDQIITYPDVISEFFSQLGIISGLSEQLQPFGFLNAIWSQYQDDPNILNLRHTTKIRDADVNGVLERFLEVHTIAKNNGEAPPPFVFTGEASHNVTDTIETDPIKSFTNLKAVASDNLGNLFNRKSLLIDPQLALYARNQIRLDESEQTGPWANRKIEFLNDFDKTRMSDYASFVRQDSFLSRKRKGIVLLKRSVDVWDPNQTLNPYELRTKSGNRFKIETLSPKNFGSQIFGNLTRSKIVIGNQNLINNIDFDSYIFIIHNPAIFSDNNRNWLIRLINEVEFGIYLPNFEYTSFSFEMTHQAAVQNQISLDQLLMVQEGTVSSIIFPDSRHILPSPYHAPMGQMFRYVYPTHNDGVELIGKDWYQILDKLSDNIKVPSPGFFDTGRLTQDFQPSYSDGLLKKSVNALSMSNQLIAFLPSSRLGESFKIRVVPPSSILPA
ncbi:MAG: P2 [Corparats virus 1]|nr:MAG: P2 [Corparats virus 1]